ncbi:GNAT family N-acetyltransferase [Dyadobacter tibetensis]|uniref:GNAT family N-acetyltransferase n=1 Tax=Dyadobacter tibetensis TaxID=1211851 RepID=UPI0010E9F476|nr:GNAT family N-acetyltransferase [Dyadobacter tibetensis]
MHRITNRIHARIKIQEMEDGIWISLPGLPFGGLESQSVVPSEALNFLMVSVEKWIKGQGGKAIVIRMPSKIYPTAPSLRRVDWPILGYEASARLVNIHIPLSNFPFEARLHKSERRRLRKCLASGFTANILQDVDIESWYNWLAKQWEIKGYAPSVSCQKLCSILSEDPDRYYFHEIVHNKQRIATGLLVKAHAQVFYTFLMADRADYRSYSPMVMLYASMFETARLAGAAFLDLGTSLDQTGQFKESLGHFKMNLGGQVTHKIEWRKMLL